MLSMALVVQMIVRISRSNWRKGTNSAQELVHSRIIAGYFFSHLSLNSAKASSAVDSDTAVYTGLRSRAIAE